MKNKTIAIVYDWDKTLSPRNMQEFGMIEQMGYSSPAEFWAASNDMSVKYNMDRILAYMLLMARQFPNISDETLKEAGHNIEFYPGVEEWFSRINDYAASKGITIEHYVVSSGLKPVIMGSKIAKEFKQVYACNYVYLDGIIFPKRLVNYTTKTQYIFRINKGVFNENNDKDLNRSMVENKKHIPLTHMIYIADGFTDVPCMKTVKANGGCTLAVYEPGDTRTARTLYKAGRVNDYLPADYTENSKLDLAVKDYIDQLCKANEQSVTALPVSEYEMGEAQL